MRLSQTLDLRHQQTQRIAPRQILASEILAWTGAELEAAIERESAENPALEKRDDFGSVVVDPAPLFSSFTPERNFWDTAAETTATDPFDRVSCTITLREHLRGQIGLAASPSHFSHVDSSEREIVAYLIECLDDRGYLAVESEEIAERFGVRRGEVEHAIWTLQTMEPAGVGARNLRECLCLQAEYLHQTGDLPPLVYAILTRCWDDLVAHREERIARRLSVPVPHVTAALSALQHTLTPSPGASFRPIGGTCGGAGEGGLPAVRPDIVFERTEMGLTAALPRTSDEAMGVAGPWKQIADCAPPSASAGHAAHTAYPSPCTDEALRRYAREQVERAETFLLGLKRRHMTLKRIADALAEQQSGFVETGSRAFLRPLTRQALADALNLDESIISRAVADKWARLPNGEVVALDAFFGGAHAIRETLASLVANEDTRHPLSDDELVTLLSAQGFDIARRTVAKYRALEKILPARMRRRGGVRGEPDEGRCGGGKGSWLPA